MNSLAPAEWERTWDSFMVPALEDVIRRTGANWRPEDVREALESGAAIKFSPVDEEGFPCSLEGFVVLRGAQDPDGTKVLHVWIAWSAVDRGVESYWDDIRSIAREGGFEQIEFRSPRKGWERVAKKIGMRPVSTIYRGDA